MSRRNRSREELLATLNGMAEASNRMADVVEASKS